MSDGRSREAIEMLVLVGILIVFARTAVKQDAAEANPTSRPHNNAVIWVDDRSQSRWPVRSLANAWADGSDVTFRYGSCPATAPCIRVSGSILPPTSNGPVWASVEQSEYQGQTRSVVKLNYGRVTTADQRKSVVCRALGRALGVTPRSGRDTCMSVEPNGRRTPSKSDLAAVDALY